MARSDLERRARRFAETVQHLLNSTVADHVNVQAAATSDAGVFSVGPGLSARNPRARPVKMRTADPTVPVFLDVFFMLSLDTEGEFLTVRSSSFGVRGAPDEAQAWFHYDYERDKAGYAEAHLQIVGRHEKLERAMSTLSRRRKRKGLGDMHFPVGGRRFRPALEDVIESLIEEELVEPKEGWEKELERSRREFRDIQLRAAIRRAPDVAGQALADLARR
ncbi:hypothetical protein [Actinoplanes sp. RD1]|uniref:hypothetical protein n=1 Tax=Actinoplanes sp. RD1 TaxID=3064538 RepID=UPI00274089FE|nr:hypothetical protein [Actinoplanes sp. RD1]